MPGRWYAGLEIVIGVWALFLVILIPQVNELVVSLIGPEPNMTFHWSIAFLLPALTLLPATFAMGATLPAMDRFMARLRQEGRSIGGLYATNTLGAVFGTMVTTFWVIPTFGFRSTVLLLAAINFLVALVVSVGPARCESVRSDVFLSIGEIGGSLRLGSTVFMTGTLGIGYEVLGIRVMSQGLQNTIYTFASVLSAWLLSTAAGAVAYQRFMVGDAKRDPQHIRSFGHEG